MKQKTIKLYKYHKYNMHLVELLTLNAFHCSTRTELNDPYDLNMRISDEFVHNLIGDEEELLFNPYNVLIDFYNELYILDNAKAKTKKWKTDDWLDLIFENEDNQMLFVNKLLDASDYKVVSLSKQVKPEKEILMWAHYAGFDGVRLTFKLQEIYDHVDYLQSYSVATALYDNDRPIIDSIMGMEVAMYFKNRNWKYENEYRILKQFTNKLYFNPHVLTEITFGYKMTNEQINTMVKLVHELKYTHVVFNRLKLKINGIKIEPIKENEIKEMLED